MLCENCRKIPEVRRMEVGVERYISLRKLPGSVRCFSCSKAFAFESVKLQNETYQCRRSHPIQHSSANVLCRVVVKLGSSLPKALTTVASNMDGLPLILVRTLTVLPSSTSLAALRMSLCPTTLILSSPISRSIRHATKARRMNLELPALFSSQKARDVGPRDHEAAALNTAGSLFSPKDFQDGRRRRRAL